MARLQQGTAGRRSRGECFGAGELKRALRTWAHEKETVPPMKFGDLRRKRTNETKKDE